MIILVVILSLKHSGDALALWLELLNEVNVVLTQHCSAVYFNNFYCNIVLSSSAILYMVVAMLHIKTVHNKRV